MLAFFSFVLLILVLGLVVFIVLRSNRKVLVVTLLVGVLFALINILVVRTFLLSNVDDIEYDETAVFPAEPWRKIITLKQPVEGFDFRPDHGLFLKSETAEIRVTGKIPGCLEEGGIAQSYQDNSARRPIERTTSPEIQLPPPPEIPLHQISFDFPIQDQPEIDNVFLGASAFAVFSNGEFWCTEREVHRGPLIGLGVGFAQGIKNLMVLGATFLLSFLGVEVGVISIMKLQER